MRINLKFLFILSVLVFMLSACAHDTNLKQLTSLSVDCKTENVKISDDSIALNDEESWTAKCNGKTYSCEYLAGSDLNCYELDK